MPPTNSSTDSKCIARFWKRADGTSCYLYKCADRWWLTIERDGETVKELRLAGASEAFRIAKEWRAA